MCVDLLLRRRQDGSLHVFDDFREAYSWLRHNTPEDAKVSFVTMQLLGKTMLLNTFAWTTVPRVHNRDCAYTCALSLLSMAV